MLKTLKKGWSLVDLFVSIVFLTLFFFSLTLPGCMEEELFESPAEPLLFSRDTLRFDTVFTSLGSATRSIRVVNPSSQNISINSIRFINGESTKFRMNVDGISNRSFENVEILANDSIYIFVEVTIDPDEPLSSSPFVVEDGILFENPGLSQKLYLEAWGQNANYIPSRFSGGQLAQLTCNGGTVTWNDPRPYVVYGILFIDDCELQLPPGTQIFVHGGLANLEGNIINDGALFFQKNGKLTSAGTVEQPVVFQGDRLESAFTDISGQWVGLRFLAGSKGNTLRYTTIKNSIVGIRVDSSSSVIVDKSKFFNTSNAGIIGVHSDITITNSLFFENGSNSLLFAYGGNYNIEYTTIANYINQAPAVFMNNFLCRDPLCTTAQVFPINVQFTNSIIVGSNGDELLFVDATDGQEPETFSMSFKNCLVKIDELENDPIFTSACSDCISNSLQDSIFVNLDENDFHLNDLSAALGQGVPLDQIMDDIEENARDSENPDLGCFEHL